MGAPRAEKTPKDSRRRKYAEYDPFKAQDEINENNANKGTRMLVTNRIREQRDCPRTNPTGDKLQATRGRSSRPFPPMLAIRPQATM